MLQETLMAEFLELGDVPSIDNATPIYIIYGHGIVINKSFQDLFQTYTNPVITISFWMTE
jgi:hypothetical protein